MLKVYEYDEYVSIDGADWCCINNGHKIANDELTDCLILDNVTFDEAREYLSNNNVRGMYRDHTFFRKRPVIIINYGWGWDPVRYKHFKSLSYKKVYKEWKDVSMRWLMNNASADELIQYLKERGVTACPILK